MPFLSYLVPMSQLKLVKICPSIPKIWINLDSAVEPAASFADFTFAPEQSGMRE